MRETNCAIHWIVIYPVDSVIQLLNKLVVLLCSQFRSQIILTYQILFFHRLPRMMYEQSLP